MAKYQTQLRGNFDDLLNRINTGILKGSVSASYEDGSDYSDPVRGVRCSVRVYERYSYIGKNRVSLNLTLLGNGDDLYVTAITSGGSQAMFFKINTIGEESFLKCISDIINKHKKGI
ncbi:MAG: DUF6054 family protein [Oscillospiraceae bacterium]|nr:DUF6054 family protein [Oscillospiraceae bacterium]